MRRHHDQVGAARAGVVGQGRRYRPIEDRHGGVEATGQARQRLLHVGLLVGSAHRPHVLIHDGQPIHVDGLDREWDVNVEQTESAAPAPRATSTATGAALSARSEPSNETRIKPCTSIALH